MEANSGIQEAGVEVTAPNPPAPGADVQKPIPTEGDAPAETQEETTEQKEVREKSKFQRRLDRHKAAAVEAKTEARLLRERLDKLEAQGKPNQDTGEPKRDGINPATGAVYTFEEYLEARSDWRADQRVDTRLKSEREAREGKEKQAQAADGNAKIAKAWTEREAAFLTANKDYDKVVEAFVGDGGEMESLSREARAAIVESDVGPALLYFLAKHPEQADKLADLSPLRQVAELGKMESKVSMPGKKTTSAPAPASTTSGGRTATADIEKMTQTEYEAYRKAQGARWAR